MTTKEELIIKLIQDCEVAHYMSALDDVTNLKLQLLLKDALVALKESK